MRNIYMKNKSLNIIFIENPTKKQQRLPSGHACKEAGRDIKTRSCPLLFINDFRDENI